MKPVIEIKDLSKSYGTLKAVDNLSFSVGKGELFAFLGVNGAGKSTTISIMCGALSPDSGSVFINSEDALKYPEKVKAAIGVVFQESLLDKPLSARSNLRSRAALYQIHGKDFDKRLSELSALLDLDEILDRPLSKLSGGQRRRVDIARALIHSPKVLILDEPTTGLDPQTRKNLWGVISSLRKNDGLTVFLTTHYMEEAADADNVLIINKGRAIASGSPLELKNKYSGDYITLYTEDEAKIKKLSVRYEKQKGSIKLFVPDTKSAAELIVNNRELFTDFEITKGKMDDVFLALTGISSEKEDEK